MTFNDAMLYLDSKKLLGSRPGLDAVKALLYALKNPEKRLRVIHLAGTNGKGSVGSFLSHILQQAGYKVGFFSSPAVFHICEMIKINNQSITEDDFADVLNNVKQCSETIEAQGTFSPTEFEIITGVAFSYFQKHSCDYVIVECGMGGRLDATNTMDEKELAILTKIDYDHIGFLGESLGEITCHKCGIFRKNTPVVVYPEQEAEAVRTIQQEADVLGCPLYILDKKSIKISQCDACGSVFTYKNFHGINISLLGKHQIYNAIVALESALQLREKGALISDSDIQIGLMNTRWEGRFERLSEAPPVILDGAHNLNGVKAFVETVTACYPGRSFIGVVAMLKDKDYKACLQLFAKVCRMLVVTEVDSIRTAKAEDLAEIAQKLGITVFVEKIPEQAIGKAFALKKSDEGVFCVGSLYNLSIYRRACEKEL